jgi:hypothetical protein
MNGPPEKGKAAGALETPTTAGRKAKSTDSIRDAANERNRTKRRTGKVA